jgi:hypothetical protein
MESMLATISFRLLQCVNADDIATPYIPVCFNAGISSGVMPPMANTGN